MTDDPEATEPEANTEASTEQETPPETPPEPQAASQEAAKYRTRLRDSEARVAALQRREVDRLSSAHLAQPGDLFDIAGASLADLCDSEGNVDAEAVEAAALALVNARPGLGKMIRRGPDFGAGNRGSVPRSQPAAWHEVIGRNRR